jgi:hypothetical protein
MITKEDVVGVINGIIGTKEDPAGSNHNFITEWYADTSGQDWARRSNPWCAMTITWVLHKVGMTWFVYAYCPYIERDARAGVNGMSWGREPRVGSPVLYDLNGSNMATHVGMVTEVHPDGTFSTVEGNWRDAVTPLVRDMKYVRGFVYLPYDNSAPSDQGDDDMWTEEEKKTVLNALKAHGEAIERLETAVRGDSGILPIVEQVRGALQPANKLDQPLAASTIDTQLKQIRRAERRVASAAGVTEATVPVNGNMLEA